jgi:hypothetical protein
MPIDMMNYETRRKISLALKGRKKTIQHKKRIAQSLQGLPKGTKHKEAIAEALREYHNNNRIKPIKDER